MSRRRHLTAAKLAAELRCDVEDVIEMVRAGKMAILAPPRRVTERVPGPHERGGGLDLTGMMAYADQDLTTWLLAYLAISPALSDAVTAAGAHRPYTDGLRLYVRPVDMANGLAKTFHPKPRPDMITTALRREGATRGRILGAVPGSEEGRLLWWRVPSALLESIAEESL